MQTPPSEELTPALPATPGEREPLISRRSLLLLLGTLALTIGLLFVPADAVERLGAYGYLGVFALVLLSSATVVLPSPAVGVALVAGRTLDPWLVGLLSGVGAGLGEITGYLVGRGGSELALRSRHYARVERWVERWGTLTIFVMAVIPTPVMDLAGIAAGALRMPFRRFLLACLLGKTVRFVAVAWIGATLLR
jgi:membrane protein YqaA with SNARE-associated domain